MGVLYLVLRVVSSLKLGNHVHDLAPVHIGEIIPIGRDHVRVQNVAEETNVGDVDLFIAEVIDHHTVGVRIVREMKGDVPRGTVVPAVVGLVGDGGVVGHACIIPEYVKMSSPKIKNPPGDVRGMHGTRHDFVRSAAVEIESRSSLQIREVSVYGPAQTHDLLADDALRISGRVGILQNVQKRRHDARPRGDDVEGLGFAGRGVVWHGCIVQHTSHNVKP